MAKIARRDLLRATPLAAGLAPNAAQTATTPIDWSKVREDFPWLKNRLWLTAADYHPLSTRSVTAMARHIRFRGYGEGGGGSWPFGSEELATKQMFAELIGAKPGEIAFVQSTTDGENLVIAGLHLGEAKGNVVIDDLHYQASKYMYRMLEREGRIELRIVRYREIDGRWAVHAEDMEREKMKVDISALLGGDIYSLLRERHVKAASRFAKERDEGKALKERMRCLKQLQGELDIPEEVLMSLPSLDQIRAKAAAASAGIDRDDGAGRESTNA